LWLLYDRQDPATWPHNKQRVLVRIYNPYLQYPIYQAATFINNAGPFWAIAERYHPTSPADSNITHWKMLDIMEAHNGRDYREELQLRA
jgi:hypothetical protein